MINIVGFFSRYTYALLISSVKQVPHEAVVLLNVLAGRKGSRRRNQKLMINIVGFFSRYTYHSLLVVQGSISIAYWSSQPSVPQHTTTPPRAAPQLLGALDHTFLITLRVGRADSLVEQ